MTLDQYREACGWSKSELSRASGISIRSVQRAILGETITSNTANKLALAVSKQLGRSIRYQDIEGLNITANS